LEFDICKQIWKHVSSLLHIVLCPSDKACEGQLFGFRLSRTNALSWLISLTRSNYASRTKRQKSSSCTLKKTRFTLLSKIHNIHPSHLKSNSYPLFVRRDDWLNFSLVQINELWLVQKSVLVQWHKSCRDCVHCCFIIGANSFFDTEKVSWGDILEKILRTMTR